MFIKEIIYKAFHVSSLQERRVRARYLEYCNDLQKRFGLPQNQINHSGKYFHGHELGYQLFERLNPLHNLSSLDLILFPCWSIAIDPDYASHEMHYKQKFNLPENILDVRDCGSLCVYYAMGLLLELFNHCNDYNLGACCVIESSSREIQTNKHCIIPELNYVSGVIFTKNNICNSEIEVIVCKVINNVQTLRLRSLLENLINKYLIGVSKLVIYRKENSKLFGKSEIRNIPILKSSNVAVKDIRHPMSSGFVLYNINMMKRTIEMFGAQFALILDEDAESDSIGILFLKITNRG